MSFGPIEVAWGGDVLEPRPWTLAQSEWAVDLAAECPPGPVLELFAGVGHIGQAVASLTRRPLVQVDLSAEACRWARRNAEANVLDDVEVRCGDVTEALGADERFPLVLADPPYIPTNDVGRFPEDPEHAIDGGGDGLQLVRLAIAVARDHLVGGGSLVLQIRDRSQGGQVDRLLAADDPLTLVEVREAGEAQALALLRRR